MEIAQNLTCTSATLSLGDDLSPEDFLQIIFAKDRESPRIALSLDLFCSKTDYVSLR